MYYSSFVLGDLTVDVAAGKLILPRSLRIIAERASKEQSWDILLEDLRSKHKPRRNRAINAIHFLVASRACRTCKHYPPLPPQLSAIN